MEKKKKERKMIDLDSVLIKHFLISNIIIFICSVINGLFFHKDLVIGFILGWCICGMVVILITNCVADNNFKCLMEKYERIIKEKNENGEESGRVE